MNCMDAQALVEDALDEALTGNRRRALDLHLSRCDACRAFFAAEKEEHSRWFRAMNDPAVCRRLPEGFAEGISCLFSARQGGSAKTLGVCGDVPQNRRRACGYAAICRAVVCGGSCGGRIARR